MTDAGRFKLLPVGFRVGTQTRYVYDFELSRDRYVGSRQHQIHEATKAECELTAVKMQVAGVQNGSEARYFATGLT
jgi:hypothetical protein